MVGTKIFSLRDVPHDGRMSGVLAEFFLGSLVDLIQSGNPGDYLGLLSSKPGAEDYPGCVQGDPQWQI
jgi:hypothetical protein